MRSRTPRGPAPPKISSSRCWYPPMAFGVSANRSLASRGPSPGFRFTLYAIMSDDAHVPRPAGRLAGAGALRAAGARPIPIQLAVSSPSAAWRWLRGSRRDARRAAGRERASCARASASSKSARHALRRPGARERASCAGCATALPPVAERWLVAEVMNVEPNSLRQSVLLNRGTRNGVFKSQAVLDDHGLLGQTTHVGPWSCRSHPDHGSGARGARADRTHRSAHHRGGHRAKRARAALSSWQCGCEERAICSITSGLGGVFPQGYPVARVAEVQRDAVQPLAQVRATPLARSIAIAK